MEEIRFDDIDKLRGKVSDTFGPFGSQIEVTQEMINKFLTRSLLPVLRAGSDYRIVGYGNATNYGADKLRFVSPVPAGAKIHARSRLVAVEAKPKGTQITQEINVHVVGNDKPALIYVMLVLYHPATK
jgi:acyl dehydratase